MNDLEFTGERVVPDRVDRDLWAQHVARYAFASRWLSGKRVLDFGCGTGYGAQILSTEGATLFIGCDLSVASVGYANRSFDSFALGFVAADCGRTPFQSGWFDALVSFEVIEHVSSYLDYLTEARRVLNDDGLLILSTPNKRVYTDESQNDPNPYHTKEFYLEELMEALAKDFAAVEIYGQAEREVASFTRLLQSDEAADPDFSVRSMPPGEKHWGRSPNDFEYFVAVCAVRALPEMPNQTAHSMVPVCGTQFGEFRKTLVGLRNELEQRSAWSIALDHKLEERKQELVRLTDELEKRSTWAEALDEELEARVAQVVRLRAEVEERSAWAESVDREVEQRNHDLRALRKEFDERTERVRALEREVEQRSQELLELRGEFDERTEWALRLDRENRELQSAIEDLKSQLEHLSGMDHTT